MSLPLLSVEIRYEHDVVLARRRARQVAEALGFGRQDQVRMATAASELARNAFQYAHGGRVEFMLHGMNPQTFRVRVSDRGKGIKELKSILNGDYSSATGMGLGLIGTRRLMDEFEIETDAHGTIIMFGKKLPPDAPALAKEQLSGIADSLARENDQEPFAEIQRQNQELLAMMGELEKRQQELALLNRELEDTNRGVVALYAELDQRADYLRQVLESKTRFLSNLTHEFRTPLNSIISISRMLSDRLDGELTPEQATQVEFIRRAAADLSHLVDDLLDLAKVEAGKVAVRPETFDLASVLASLRGTLRPLLEKNSSVSLVFEEPEGIPKLHMDESKLSQILRNFISNALKYTERGEVRVSARMDDAEHILVSVADTGIGIAPEDQTRIFQEFEQVEGPHQLKVKGTGLGLSLASKLAELLGGKVSVESQLGIGSTFSVRLPVRHESASSEEEAEAEPQAHAPSQPRKILIVDDDEASRYILKELLAENKFQILEAAGGAEGLEQASTYQPDLVFLDLGLPDMEGSSVLRALKNNDATAGIPVIINTSRTLTPVERESYRHLTVAILSKNHQDLDVARKNLRTVLSASGIKE